MSAGSAPTARDRAAAPVESTTPDAGSGLAGHARAQQRRVDRLLAYRESRRWALPSVARRELGDLGRSLSRDTADPEFRKNLRIFRRLVGEAAALHERAEQSMAEAAQPAAGPVAARRAGVASGSEAADRRRQAAILDRVDELRERTALPTDLPLTLKTLLAHRFGLERLLIELGDEEYLTGRLAEVYDETGTPTTWQELFGRQRPALLPGVVEAEPPSEVDRPEAETLPRTATPGARSASGARDHAGTTAEDEGDAVEATRWRLGRLMRVKEAEDEVSRSRLELKRHAALLVTWVLAAVTLLFVGAVAWAVDDDRLMLATVAAGATGAALGGLLSLRDEVSLGTQVRQFSPFFIGEVVVGAAAGLATFLIDQWGIVEVGGQGIGVAALAFAIGFSEAALLGLLAKLAGSVGGAGGQERRPEAPER